MKVTIGRVFKQGDEERAIDAVDGLEWDIPAGASILKIEDTSRGLCVYWIIYVPEPTRGP